ncbi:MAG TPA: DUF4178 domain-containing protein, partial [Terriglobia bacterium]|nr:DUF4178 domain-containing protein [Terriglobia bacterium]
LIPLGARGKVRGTQYEIVGFQRRTIHVDGVAYSWREYLLFNPFKGFRYLSEYNGHWNDITVLKTLPVVLITSPPRAVYMGETYKHFQTSQAATTFVLGEFPWQIRVGEAADVTDYVSPPRMLSSERTGNEVTWSQGEYMSGSDVWKAFSLPGQPPVATGVFENQPSPLKASVAATWKAVGLLTMALLALMIVMAIVQRHDDVFAASYFYNTNHAPSEEQSFVTPVFELKGHDSAVEVDTRANVDNSWIYVNYALINEQTAQAYDFGREVSYYHGYDSDGSWTEGKNSDSAVVPSVPPGRYYLRVEPESDRGKGIITYSIEIHRDVPQLSWYGLGFLALLVPAVLVTWRSMSFEHLRWAESDHAPVSSSDDD